MAHYDSLRARARTDQLAYDNPLVDYAAGSRALLQSIHDQLQQRDQQRDEMSIDEILKARNHGRARSPGPGGAAAAEDIDPKAAASRAAAATEDSETEEGPFATLNPDMISLVCKFLPARSLPTAEGVNLHWRASMSSNQPFIYGRRLLLLDAPSHAQLLEVRKAPGKRDAKPCSRGR